MYHYGKDVGSGGGYACVWAACVWKIAALAAQKTKYAMLGSFY